MNLSTARKAWKVYAPWKWFMTYPLCRGFPIGRHETRDLYEVNEINHWGSAGFVSAQPAQIWSGSIEEASVPNHVEPDPERFSRDNGVMITLSCFMREGFSCLSSQVFDSQAAALHIPMFVWNLNKCSWEQEINPHETHQSYLDEIPNVVCIYIYIYRF